MSIKKALPDQETKKGFYLKGNSKVGSAIPKPKYAKTPRQKGTVKKALSK